MVRKLKYHERKLLKKVDFINWDNNNVKEIAIMRKYNITRLEYTQYNRLVREIQSLADKIHKLELGPFRVKQSSELCEHLYSMGLIDTKRLTKCQAMGVKSFCKRRLPVFMVKSGMFHGPVSVATKYVQHGHVRVGPHVVKDPAFLVTRNHEDFLTWTDNFKRKIEEYNNEKDDYQD